MNILGEPIPDELLKIFKLWCDLTDFPYHINSFEDFIKDALLHRGETFNRVFKIRHNIINIMVEHDTSDFYIFGKFQKDVALFFVKF